MLVPGESTLNGTGEIVEKHGSESYVALVWRRLKRSWTGMAGLVMVILLVFIALFADFVSPVDPKCTDVGYSQPETISFTDKDGGWAFAPRIYPMVEGAELDPITYQPLIGPDYDNPRYLGFFVKGAPYRLLWLIPAERHLFGAIDGKPVGDLKVEFIEGGTRYRNADDAQDLVTDAKGELTLNAKQAGMYYLEASHAVEGKDGQPGRRASYAAVLEFLPL